MGKDSLKKNERAMWATVYLVLTLIILLLISGCEGFFTQDYDQRGFHVMVSSESGCHVEITKDTTRGGPGASANQPKQRVYD